tara:strand:- start:387 stop:725 length:339 start_codon:yes stop_codon:yes gene_type:complete
MNDWIKWGEANPPRFLQRADGTVFVVRNETVTQLCSLHYLDRRNATMTNENKSPAMKGNDPIDFSLNARVEARPTFPSKENKSPAMKGNRNPFAQNSVRSMKAACKGRKVIK